MKVAETKKFDFLPYQSIKSCVVRYILYYLLDLLKLIGKCLFSTSIINGNRSTFFSHLSEKIPSVFVKCFSTFPTFFFFFVFKFISPSVYDFIFKMVETA